MNTGMDRDIALQIVSLLSDCDSLLETINNNEYAAHIIEQPEDSVTAVTYTASFTVVAVNVKSYQWQYKSSEEATTWSNLGGISNEATLSINATEARYAWRFRCEITGLDNVKVYTDTVKIIAPET